MRVPIAAATVLIAGGILFIHPISGNAQGPPPLPVSGPPAAPDAEWYLAENGVKQGPLGTSALAAMIGRGEVFAETLVWTSTMKEWAKAGKVDGLAAHFAATGETPAPQVQDDHEEGLAEDDEPQRRFEGSIGSDLEVTLLLTMAEDVGYSGSYHDHRTGVSNRLVQDTEIEDPIRLLDEGVDVQGRDALLGRWDVTLEDGKITGTWSSEDGGKKLPIVLEESYPAGSSRARAAQLSGERLLVNYGRTHSVRTMVRYVRLTPETPAAKAINSALRQEAFLGLTSKQDPGAGAVGGGEAARAVGGNSSKNDLLAAVHASTDVDLANGDFSEFGISWGRMRDCVQRLVMNESGFVTVEQVTFSYEGQGGSYGDSARVYRNFDLDTGQEIPFGDLVNPGFEKRWEELIALQLRARRGLERDAPLTEAGLDEDKLALNKTWFLAPGGIGFSYDPSEIGFLDKGDPVEFVLPWKDILSDLKPGTRVIEIAARRASQER